MTLDAEKIALYGIMIGNEAVFGPCLCLLSRYKVAIIADMDKRAREGPTSKVAATGRDERMIGKGTRNEN